MKWKEISPQGNHGMLLFAWDMRQMSCWRASQPLCDSTGPPQKWEASVCTRSEGHMALYTSPASSVDQIPSTASELTRQRSSPSVKVWSQLQTVDILVVFTEIVEDFLTEAKNLSEKHFADISIPKTK